MHPRVPQKARNLLISWANVSFWRKTLIHEVSIKYCNYVMSRKVWYDDCKWWTGRNLDGGGPSSVQVLFLLVWRFWGKPEITSDRLIGIRSRCLPCEPDAVFSNCCSWARCLVPIHSKDCTGETHSWGLFCWPDLWVKFARGSHDKSGATLCCFVLSDPSQ
jgi:hypothetical protein